MTNQKLLIFFAHVSIAVCMDIPFHKSEQKLVLYCPDEKCMRCTACECTLPITQGCTTNNNSFPQCPYGNWRNLKFNGNTSTTETSISGQHHIGNRTPRRSEPLSFKNYGLHLCESMENTLPSKCLYLMPYHQATVSINDNSTVYNGSCYRQSVDYHLKVKENDSLNITCQPAGYKQHWKCPNSSSGIQPLIVGRDHSQCNFQCTRSVYDDFTCTINIKLEVVLPENKTFQGTERKTLFGFDSKTTTERPLISDSLTTLGQSGKEQKKDMDNKQLLGKSILLDLFVISLILVVILLTILSLLRSKRDSRSDCTNRNSFQPSITHTYATTGCLMDETSLQTNNEEMNNSTPILNLRGNNFHSSETSQRLPQIKKRYNPGRVITPYAVTCIWDNSLKLNNALPRAPEGDVNTFVNVNNQTRAEGDQDQQDQSYKN